MQRTLQTTRQMMGCGYEAADPRLPVVAGGDHPERKGPPLTTCAGYTTKLPEVIETAKLLRFMKDGALATKLRGEPLSEPAERALLILDNAENAAEAWLSKPQDGAR